jgi:hypothetical protein
MPKANPLAKIATKLSALQTKSDKLSSSIKVLTTLVADEAKKAAASPVPSKPSAKAPAKAKAASRTAVTKKPSPKSK